MKILIADTFEPGGLDLLRSAGCEVLYSPDLRDEALAGALRDSAAEVLVVRGTTVTAAMLHAPALSLVVRAGAGYNTIDVAAASARGIFVSNCPGMNATAVAELAFGLIIALDRRIPDNVAALREGRWDKREYSQARGLYGRTLGLLGYGHIGQEMARRAQAFGMPTLVWSRRFAAGARGAPDATDAPPGLPAGSTAVRLAASPQEVAEGADVLSVHLALAPETRGLVDASVLDRLRPGSYVINTARGELVDYAALARVVAERGIRVGLDVFAAEPSSATGAFSDPLVSLPGVYGTHHIGASTAQAQEAIAAEAVRVVLAYQRTGRVPNVVNLAARSPATHRLVVRHRDRPGVLAHVFDRLREGGLNVQETENVIFAGAEAAVAHVHVDGRPPDALVQAIREGSRDIFDVHVVSI